MKVALLLMGVGCILAGGDVHTNTGTIVWGAATAVCVFGATMVRLAELKVSNAIVDRHKRGLDK